MGARRRIETTDGRAAAEAAPRPAPSLALARAGAAPAASPVHDHLARLEASFAETAGPPPFPRSVRLAIMVGAPVALWALVILAVGAVAHAVGA